VGRDPQNLMKLGHNKRARMPMPDDQKPSVRKIKEWVVGMSFFSVGNILNFTSFGRWGLVCHGCWGWLQHPAGVPSTYHDGGPDKM
jgi:hypothetical protein